MFKSIFIEHVANLDIFFHSANIPLGIFAFFLRNHF